MHSWWERGYKGEGKEMENTSFFRCTLSNTNIYTQMKCTDRGDRVDTLWVRSFDPKISHQYRYCFLTACKSLWRSVHFSWDVWFKKPRHIQLRDSMYYSVFELKNVGSCFGRGFEVWNNAVSSLKTASARLALKGWCLNIFFPLLTSSQVEMFSQKSKHVVWKNVKPKVTFYHNLQDMWSVIF